MNSEYESLMDDLEGLTDYRDALEEAIAERRKKLDSVYEAIIEKRIEIQDAKNQEEDK